MLMSLVLCLSHKCEPGLSFSYSFSFKPRSNNRNASMWQIATLLGVTYWARFATVLRHVGCCWLIFNWPFSNLSQQHPTCRNTVAKHRQHVAPNNVALCSRWRLTRGQACKYSSALSPGQTIAIFQLNTIPTLLAQHLKLRPIDRIIWTTSFAKCWVLKVEVARYPGATLMHEPGQTSSTSSNIHKCFKKKKWPFSNSTQQPPWHTLQ